MKKIIFGLALVCAFCMFSCGKATKAASNGADSTVVDTVKVDTATLVVDTVAVDTTIAE